ncbi:hypothetical protein [Jeotgalibacillus proteolyticus]|nr:hypothetical protein [Jeotgalibacillus proteolyticus]
MNKILPIISSIGVGLAAYQMFSGNGKNMNNMISPLASNLMGSQNGNGKNQRYSYQ